MLLYRYLKMLDFTYVCKYTSCKFFQPLTTSQAISTHCVLYSVVIIPLLPVHRTIENFSVELSRADAAATALQLVYILSSHHAQEILPRKLEYYLPVPCQIRHIDFDACYSLCSSPFALCRSDSCWVMEFKVLVYSSLNWPNLTWILLKLSIVVRE